MQGAFHCEELILKAGAGSANRHVQSQLCCLFQAERTILHSHHHVGDFFAASAEGVIHGEKF